MGSRSGLEWRRSSGQTTEPSQEVRDRNQAFYLFRFSRYSRGFFLLFFLQECQEAGGRERETGGYNDPNMIYHITICETELIFVGTRFFHTLSLSLSWNLHMVPLVGLSLKSVWDLWFPAMLLLFTSVVSSILCSRISLNVSHPENGHSGFPTNVGTSYVRSP